MGTPRMPLVACTLQTKQAQTYVTDIRKTGLEGEIIVIRTNRPGSYAQGQARSQHTRRHKHTHKTSRRPERAPPPVIIIGAIFTHPDS